MKIIGLPNTVRDLIEGVLGYLTRTNRPDEFFMHLTADETSGIMLQATGRSLTDDLVGATLFVNPGGKFTYVEVYHRSPDDMGEDEAVALPTIFQCGSLEVLKAHLNNGQTDGTTIGWKGTDAQGFPGECIRGCEGYRWYMSYPIAVNDRVDILTDLLAAVVWAPPVVEEPKVTKPGPDLPGFMKQS